MSDSIDEWIEQMPNRDGFPFPVSPKALYTVPELCKGFDFDKPSTYRDVYDQVIYRWTRDKDQKERKFSVEEGIATRIHDSAMDRHVADFLDPSKGTSTIGVMGGHAVTRTQVAYLRVAKMARELRRRNFMIVTGGGPGLMEAANFGAFMAPYDDAQFMMAMQTLRQAPSFGTDPATEDAEKAAWVLAAAEVRTRLLGKWDARELGGSTNLGIPTWHYGTEPPNLFATHAGKYFENSLREDGLVSVANSGLIFGKGDAGTVQEVFQNANYNYYRESDEWATPMVFFDINFWNPNQITDTTAGAPLDSHRKPVFPLIQKLATECAMPFDQVLMLSNDPDEIVEFLTAKNADNERKQRSADRKLEAVISTPRCRLFTSG